MRGPLRSGEVGEVVQVGGGHVSVRSATTGRRWWYDAVALVEVCLKPEDFTVISISSAYLALGP